MANQRSKKTPRKATQTRTKRSEPMTATSKIAMLRAGLQRIWQKIKKRRRDFLSRRPHRSFRRTRRRDSVRSLNIPGYWALTAQAWQLVWAHKRTFFGLALIYAAVVFVLSGLMDQDTYKQIKATAESSVESGFVSSAFATFAVFGGVVAGQFSQQPKDAVPQLLGALALIMVWLTTIWLLRAISADKNPKIRDGVYSAGSPLIALLVLFFITLVQLLPAALGVILYTALHSAEILTQTPMLAIAAVVAGLLGVLSLYWTISTAFAMVIVTLPGMYPMRAVRMAGDIVVGRRIRVLLRLLWLVMILAIVWAIILLPIISFDSWLSSVVDSAAEFPLIPIVVLLIASFSVVFAAVYIYLFYRKVVADDSAPA